jgi:hypothetical protein
LHLFSFFNAHDPQVWSFDGVAEFLHIPFTALEFLELFDSDFFHFFFNFYFIFKLWDFVAIVLVCWSGLTMWDFCCFYYRNIFYLQDFCLILSSEVFLIFVKLHL